MKLPYRTLKNLLSTIGKEACAAGITAVVIAGLVLPAQTTFAQNSQSQPQSGQQQNGQQQPEVPEAGGPAGDTGPMAVPKKSGGADAASTSAQAKAGGDQPQLFDHRRSAAGQHRRLGKHEGRRFHSWAEEG